MLAMGLLLLATLSLTIAGLVIRPGRAIQVASGLVSHTLCSAAFVSGLDPDQVYLESMRPRRGMGLIAWALRYRIDWQRREVVTSIAGFFRSRAVYRRGYGCLLVHNDSPLDFPPFVAPATPSLLPPIAGPELVEPVDEPLRGALAHAFAEPSAPPFRWTKAVVVVQQGRLVAERYAPGYTIGTPILGYSVTKSVLSALIGILVHQGRLDLDQAVPIPAGGSLANSQHAITIDHLLRMTSGLAFTETDSGLDPVTRMLYVERDMAGYAASCPQEAAPGQRWGYSSCSSLILSRILRDAVGGSATAVLEFAHRELFGPLGMQSVTLEFDATGTPVGSTYMYASARDWARFGLLYLTDGVVGGRRILPEGWVAYSATPVPHTGYGAGFWISRVPGKMPEGIPWGLPGVPDDTYFGRGFLGQYLVIVPSRHLVVARFGWSNALGADYQAVGRLVCEAIDALPACRACSGSLR